MEQVIREQIPIRIKNVMNPRGAGTVILPDLDGIKEPLKPKLSRGRSSSSLDSLIGPKRPTAVTIKHSIVVLNIHSNQRTRAHGFLAKIFSILDQHHLSVDLISSSEVHVSMALHSEHSMLSGGVDEELHIQDVRLSGCVNDLSSIGNVDVVGDMAIVSLVGQQLKNSRTTFFLCIFARPVLTLLISDWNFWQDVHYFGRESYCTCLSFPLIFMVRVE